MRSIEVLTMILAGGAGERLYPLTAKRCKPVVPFGGTFRVIDFTLLNCALAGLRQVFVLTQHQAGSLDRHFHDRWGALSNVMRLAQLTPRPAANGNGTGGVYRGTADAVYQNLDLLARSKPAVVLILSGDHIYRADYAKLIAAHVERQADVSVLSGEVPVEEASAFGVLRLAADGRIARLAEKPADPAPFAIGGRCPINLGVYCFDAGFLRERLSEDARQESAHDFGRNVLPRSIELGRVFSLPLRAVSPDIHPYWRDIGSIDSFFQGHMDLLKLPPALDLRDPRWPVESPFHRWTPVLHSVTVAIGGRCVRVRNIISEGVRIEPAAQIANCVLSPGVRLGKGSELDGCILFHGAQVGEGAKLRKVIVEEGVRVPAGTVIGFGGGLDNLKTSPQGVTVLGEESLLRERAFAASIA